jgi:hypothetical protein
MLDRARQRRVICYHTASKTPKIDTRDPITKFKPYPLGQDESAGFCDFTRGGGATKEEEARSHLPSSYPGNE